MAIFALLLATYFTIVLFLGYRITTRFIKDAIIKVLFSVLVVVHGLSLVFGYAYFFGAGGSVGGYPVVAFSSINERVSKNSLVLLVGSDDKQYAFFVLHEGESPNDIPTVKKEILYVSRSEVKWLSIIGAQNLDTVAYFYDWKAGLSAAPKKQ